MAGSFSDYTEDKVVDHVMGKTAFTMPTTIAIAAVKTAAVDSDDGSTIDEADYTGYDRVTLTPSTDLNASSGGVMTNAVDIVLPACTGGSNSIAGIAILDNATVGAGNMLAWDEFPASLTIDTTHTPLTIPAGSLSISLT